jgi:hypothetical protein
LCLFFFFGGQVRGQNIYLILPFLDSVDVSRYSMAQLPFANDGSFMAQFMAQQAAAAAASGGIGQNWRQCDSFMAQFMAQQAAACRHQGNRTKGFFFSFFPFSFSKGRMDAFKEIIAP